jgi:hypothetical protein
MASSTPDRDASAVLGRALRVGRLVPGQPQWLRLATARLGVRRAPGFVILGAQKAGTSALYRYLLKHPDVTGAAVKETHYFDRHYDRGSHWYLSQFPLRATTSLTGEATPYYLFHPQIPRRLAELVPDARLVVLVREPAARAYSHYRHNARFHPPMPSFEAALALEERLFAARGGEPGFFDSDECHMHSYAARGRYVEQLRRWFEHFAAEQVLVLESEEFYRDPAAGFNTVLRFLGLRDWRPERFAVFNQGNYSAQELDPGTAASLSERFRSHNRELEELLGRRLDGWG